MCESQSQTTEIAIDQCFVNLSVSCALGCSWLSVALAANSPRNAYTWTKCQRETVKEVDCDPWCLEQVSQDSCCESKHYFGDLWFKTTLRQGKQEGQTGQSLNYYSTTTQLYYFGNCCFWKGSFLRIHYRNNDGCSGCQHFYRLFRSNWIGTLLHW